MKNVRLPLATTLTVVCLLTLVQLMPEKPLLLLERAFKETLTELACL